MQTTINGNKIGFSKSFDEATPEVIGRAERYGWDVEVNGGEQMVFLVRR